MERRAPASRMERAVANVCGWTASEGMSAFCCSRASFAFDSCDVACEAPPEERSDDCSDDRMLSREEWLEVADGMAKVEVRRMPL